MTTHYRIILTDGTHHLIQADEWNFITADDGVPTHLFFASGGNDGENRDVGMIPMDKVAVLVEDKAYTKSLSSVRYCGE